MPDRIARRCAGPQLIRKDGGFLPIPDSAPRTPPTPPAHRARPPPLQCTACPWPCTSSELRWRAWAASVSKMVSPVFLSSARNVDAYAPFTGVKPVASAENSSVLVTSSKAPFRIAELAGVHTLQRRVVLNVIRRLAIRNHPNLIARIHIVRGNAGR